MTSERRFAARDRGAVITVTKKDGTATALNVDRIERVEPNIVGRGRESNVFLVGGSHLVVEEASETVIDLVIEAKARVLARSYRFTDEQCMGPPPHSAPSVSFHVVEPRGAEE